MKYAKKPLNSICWMRQKLFDVESMEHAIDNFRRYSVALLQAMEEAKSLITKEE